MADQLKITIDEQGAGVSAEALRMHLEQTLRFLGGDPDVGDDVVEWKVTRVSINSPMRLKLERSVVGDAPEPKSRPGETMVRALSRLERGEDLGDEFSPVRLRALERMSSLSNGVRQVWVKAGVTPANITGTSCCKDRSMRVILH